MKCSKKCFCKERLLTFFKQALPKFLWPWNICVFMSVCVCVCVKIPQLFGKQCSKHFSCSNTFLSIPTFPTFSLNYDSQSFTPDFSCMFQTHIFNCQLIPSICIHYLHLSIFINKLCMLANKPILCKVVLISANNNIKPVTKNCKNNYVIKDWYQ